MDAIERVDEEVSEDAVAGKPKGQRRSRGWWYERYESWRRSGQSKTAFCAELGVSVSSFDNWCRRFKRAESGRGDFVPATVRPPESRSGVTLSVGEVSVRFEAPITAGDIGVWVRALKASQ